MTKCTPNQHSKLDNTYFLIYSLVKSQKQQMNLGEIDNTDCMLKSIFNDQMYPKPTQ